MTPERFRMILEKVQPYTDYIYLHILGEPLLHPQLEELISIGCELGFHVCITTNGTLISKTAAVLDAGRKLHKISISLQAQEVNASIRGDDVYLRECFDFGKEACENCIVAFRLWNEGGADSGNEHILEVMRDYFPEEWTKHFHGYKLRKNVYLESAEVFEWPELPEDGEETAGSRHFCYGLRDQIGVLADGTVVPCCLDHEGDIALGNLLTEDLGTILAGQRAQAIYEGFSRREAVEPLCRNCGYASRFQ